MGTWTYSLAKMQLRMFLLNGELFESEKYIYIRFRLMLFQVLDVDVLWVKFPNHPPKSIHTLKPAMFSTCFSVYPLLHLAHRHAASLRDIGQCPDHVCKYTGGLLWRLGAYERTIL